MGDMGLVLLGFGTVFVGLICLIYITKLMSVICGLLKDKAKAEKLQPATASPAMAAAPAPAADRQALVAAIAASVAEVMGTDVKGLRIHSIKKVD